MQDRPAADREGPAPGEAREPVGREEAGRRGAVELVSDPLVEGGEDLAPLRVDRDGDARFPGRGSRRQGVGRGEGDDRAAQRVGDRLRGGDPDAEARVRARSGPDDDQIDRPRARPPRGERSPRARRRSDPTRAGAPGSRTSGRGRGARACARGRPPRAGDAPLLVSRRGSSPLGPAALPAQAGGRREARRRRRASGHRAVNGRLPGDGATR